MRPALLLLALASSSRRGRDSAGDPGDDRQRRSGPPDVVKSLSDAATGRLLAGDRAKALDAARNGIAAVDRWKKTLGTLPPWDGTDPDAKRSLDALFALFPRGEDTFPPRSRGTGLPVLVVAEATPPRCGEADRSPWSGNRGSFRCLPRGAKRTYPPNRRERMGSGAGSATMSAVPPVFHDA